MTWYSAGTVKTTANSAVVTGTGTAWTNSGLRSGDMLLIGYSTISPRGYEIKSIDSATQITLVLPFPVAVNGAGYVGIPMLGGDRTAITMTLANQVTKALADTEAMSAVYQTFYTSPGAVSLTLPGGLVVSGSSFQKLTADMNGKANNGANNDITSLSGLTTPLGITQGGTGNKSIESTLLSYGFGGLLSGNGYSITPAIINGVKRNVITQWGTAFNGNGNTTKTAFPLPFPSFKVVVLAGVQSGGGIHTNATLNFDSNSDFTWSAFLGNSGFPPVLQTTAGSVGCRWIAIGY